MSATQHGSASFDFLNTPAEIRAHDFEPAPFPSIGKQSTGEQEELEYVRAKLELEERSWVFFWGARMFIHKE